MLRQPAQVAQDGFVGSAHIFFVLVVVQVLHVVQEQVHVGQDRLHHALGDEAAGIDRGVIASCLAGLEEFHGEGVLGERLAAGQSDAAVAFFVEGFVFHDFLHQLLHGHLLAQAFHGQSGAGVGAFAAAVAFFHVQLDAVLACGQGVLGADFDAGEAAHALIFIPDDLRGEDLGLRVVAPGAQQRAALHKNGGADARAVMDGIVLDIADQTGGHSGSPLALIWLRNYTQYELKYNFTIIAPIMQETK